MNISEINQGSTLTVGNVITTNITAFVGTIIFLAFSQGSIPGYLVCDGSFVSKTTYANLFNFLNSHNTNYPQTATEFQLPDLRGTFIRNAPMGHNTDPDGGSNRALNTLQQYALKRLSGRAGVYQNEYNNLHSRSGVFTNDLSEGSTDSGRGGDNCGRSNFDNARSVATNSVECRPNNKAMIACIKY